MKMKTNQQHKTLLGAVSTIIIIIFIIIIIM